MFGQVFIFFLAALVSFLLTLPLLQLLKFLHSGQAIREEAPQSHRAKAGTPTMGGIAIVLAIIILSLVFIDFDLNMRCLALILLMAGFALLGFFDDLFKILRRRNLGLTFWQKIVAQTLMASLFAAVVSGEPHYFFFAVFMIVGTANATNLTDGLNGLLAGCAAIAFLAFAVVASKLDFGYASSFCLISSGATFAFLYFNFPKAKLFMGDVGSLALGAALAGIAILIHREWLLALIGLVFVVEALSVILQVASYRFFKKRIFKMTPLHHHFELLGWGETYVVLFFWAAAVICGVLGILI